jgi:hypothetical protein
MTIKFDPGHDLPSTSGSFLESAQKEGATRQTRSSNRKRGIFDEVGGAAAALHGMQSVLYTRGITGARH